VRLFLFLYLKGKKQMADNDMDNGSTLEGTPTSPTAGGSQGQGASSSSFDAAKLQATLEALTKKVEEADARSRSLQGDKDRGVAKTRKEVDALKAQFAEIEKLTRDGMALDDAVEEYDFRSTVRELKTQLANLIPAPNPTAGSGTVEAANVAKVFADYGLDLKDPRVLEVAQRGYKDPDALELAAFKLSKSLAASPTPNPAQNPAGNVQQPSSNNIADVINAYEQELKAIPRGQTMAVSNLKAKYRKIAREKGFILNI
jgi:hypothetical protein